MALSFVDATHGNFMLFTTGSTSALVESRNVSGMFWYARIYQDNNIARDFIPVRRTSDGAVGMYDSVTRQFFGNSGAGEFIARPIVGAI